MKTFQENVFVHEDFLSTEKKRVIESKLASGDTQGKAYSSLDFRDKENLKLSMHLVNICVPNYKFLKKKNNKFYGIFLNVRIFLAK